MPSLFHPLNSLLTSVQTRISKQFRIEMRVCTLLKVNSISKRVRAYALKGKINFTPTRYGLIFSSHWASHFRIVGYDKIAYKCLINHSSKHDFLSNPPILDRPCVLSTLHATHSPSYSPVSTWWYNSLYMGLKLGNGGTCPSCGGVAASHTRWAWSGDTRHDCDSGAV